MTGNIPVQPLPQVFKSAYITASAAKGDKYRSGSCGTDGHESEVTWTLTQNNDDNDNPTYTLTISGTGAMADYSSLDDRPWNSYSENITAVEIADGVTGIGNGAFFRCENLTTVTISGDVGSIGEGAFSNCKILTSFSLCAKNPPSVENSSFNWSSPEIKFYVPVSSISN